MKIVRKTLVLAALFGLAACNNDATQPSGPDANLMGTTPGWLNGQVVTFEYTQNFFCRQPPVSNAPSGCEVGEAAQTRPETGTLPVLYGITPLFSPAPPAAHLHCPQTGNCVAHPSTLDVGRVLGPDARNIPLPAHSHILDNRAGGQHAWFELKIVGVTERAVWDQIVATPTLARVRQLQTANQGITADLPTNVFLRFAVR